LAFVRRAAHGSGRSARIPAAPRARKEQALSALRRRLRGWLGVDAAEQLAQRTIELSTRAADASVAATDAAARQAEQSHKLTERTARELRRLARQIAILNGIVHHQAEATTEALKRTGWQSEEDTLEQRHLQQALDAIEGTRDVIAGPWTGEVGFELLYWIPFLNWLQSHGLDGRRLIVVSRGGTAGWYSRLTSRYIDLLSLMTPEELRQRTTESPEKRKQYDPKRALDQEILSGVEAAYGVKEAALVHPAAMFRLFGALWRKRATSSLVDSFTTYQRLGDPLPADPSLGMPASYVAAKFYFSEAFPQTDENRAFVTELLRKAGETIPVVLLSTGVRIDDHADFASAAMPNVHVLDMCDEPQKNLERQTAIIRGASGFIGTYGGFSYLAPFYGIRSVSFFSRRSFESHHLELAHRVFDKLLPGGFVALDRRAIDSVEPALARWSNRSRE
jgi:hypothetical protein